MSDLININDIKEERKRIEAFTKIINSEPRVVKTHPYTKKQYSPVSEIEMILDQLFFYQWEWIDVKIELMLNSIVCSGSLRVKHPVNGKWLRRAGTGAVKLQQDSGAKVDDLAKIKSNAFDLAVPVAEAFALKNAAKKFGKVFGRDLNRNFEAEYSPLYKPDNANLLQKYFSMVDKNSDPITLLDKARKELNESDLNALKARIKEVVSND